jgi:hypothetical protein
MATWWTPAVLGVCLAAGPAIAQTVPNVNGTSRTAQREPRIRWSDARAAGLLNDAIRRSVTVRGLAEKIEASDLLMYVFVRADPGRWRGKTTLVSRGRPNRMLHTVINNGLERDEQIAVLGHELQHIWEIAQAPDVVDSDGMSRLFKRIGHQVSLVGETYETTAAEAVERFVWQEIRQMRRTF